MKNLLKLIIVLIFFSTIQYTYAYSTVWPYNSLSECNKILEQNSSNKNPEYIKYERSKCYINNWKYTYNICKKWEWCIYIIKSNNYINNEDKKININKFSDWDKIENSNEKDSSSNKKNTINNDSYWEKIMDINKKNINIKNNFSDWNKINKNSFSNIENKKNIINKYSNWNKINNINEKNISIINTNPYKDKKINIKGKEYILQNLFWEKVKQILEKVKWKSNNENSVKKLENFNKKLIILWNKEKYKNNTKVKNFIWYIKYESNNKINNIKVKLKKENKIKSYSCRWEIPKWEWIFLSQNIQKWNYIYWTYSEKTTSKFNCAWKCIDWYKKRWNSCFRNSISCPKYSLPINMPWRNCKIIYIKNSNGCTKPKYECEEKVDFKIRDIVNKNKYIKINYYYWNKDIIFKYWLDTKNIHSIIDTNYSFTNNKWIIELWDNYKYKIIPWKIYYFSFYDSKTKKNLYKWKFISQK